MVIWYNVTEKIPKTITAAYLKKFGSANREDIRKLIIGKLPDVLDERQKENKIRNILYSMKKSGMIDRDDENKRTGRWIIPKNR